MFCCCCYLIWEIMFSDTCVRSVLSFVSPSVCTLVSLYGVVFVFSTILNIAFFCFYIYLRTNETMTWSRSCEWSVLKILRIDSFIGFSFAILFHSLLFFFMVFFRFSNEWSTTTPHQNNLKPTWSPTCVTSSGCKRFQRAWICSSLERYVWLDIRYNYFFWLQSTKTLKEKRNERFLCYLSVCLVTVSSSIFTFFLNFYLWVYRWK